MDLCILCNNFHVPISIFIIHKFTPFISYSRYSEECVSRNKRKKKNYTITEKLRDKKMKTSGKRTMKRLN